MDLPGSAPRGSQITDRTSQIANRKPGFAESLEPRRLLSAIPAVLDVMVLYTPAAEQEAGGAAAISAEINQAVADTNLAFANSHVHAALRLVYSSQADYSESGSLQSDLSALQSGSGELGQVPALRASYGADLVSLWTGSGDDGAGEAGLAFQPTNLKQAQANLGYNVVVGQYADDNYVFAHEIGHNLGAGHDRSDPASPNVIPFAHGQRMSVDGLSVGGIMSEGVRIPYYSNPQVRDQGVATGSPDGSAQPADNARVMNQMAPLVATYERSEVPDTAPPLAALGQVSLNPATRVLSVTMDLSDDAGIDSSALRHSALLVSGPGGFHTRARFFSESYVGNVAQQSVTYATRVSDATIDPSSYQFTLSPDAVRDVSGNASAGGVLKPVSSTPQPWAFAMHAGPRLATAADLGKLKSSVTELGGPIGSGSESQSFYRFQITAKTQLTAGATRASVALRELIIDGANAQGQPSVGNIVGDAQAARGAPETSLSMELAPGTYYLWLAPASSGTGGDYTLELSAVPVTRRHAPK